MLSETRSESPISAPVNPTHKLWQIFIRVHRCPFVKVEPLRDNPKKLRDVHEWPGILAEVSDYDVGLIERHLRRMNTRE